MAARLRLLQKCLNFYHFPCPIWQHRLHKQNRLIFTTCLKTCEHWHMKNTLYTYIKHAYYHIKPWHFERKDPKALTMDQTRNQLFPLMVKSPHNLRHQWSKDLSIRSRHNFGHAAIQVNGLPLMPNLREHATMLAKTTHGEHIKL